MPRRVLGYPECVHEFIQNEIDASFSTPLRDPFDWISEKPKFSVAGINLERVELLRSKHNGGKTAGASIAEYADRRLTSRIYVHLPLFVYGYTPDGDPFYEETYTISINGAGGLISMACSVQPDQRLVVTNPGNDQTQECIVVSVEAQRAQGSCVAFKFSRPMSQFWRDLEIGKSPTL